MDATITEFKRCSLVKVDGRVDSSNAHEFHELLKGINDRGSFKIVLDMDAIDFMSSRGGWVLVQTQKNCKRYNRGELVLARNRVVRLASTGVQNPQEFQEISKR